MNKHSETEQEKSQSKTSMEELAESEIPEESVKIQSDKEGDEIASDTDSKPIDVGQLQSQLEQANEQINEMKEGYIRAKAEVENIQRRSRNEIVLARKYAIEGFASELLSVLDSLDQAARVDLDEASSEAVCKMKEGLELTLKQMERVMEKFGISIVDAHKGIKFDPELHQAISTVQTDEVESEHILDVMQKGYQLKDRLLRPAMVVIAKSS